MHSKRQGSALFRVEDFLDGVAGGHPPAEAAAGPLPVRLKPRPADKGKRADEARDPESIPPHHAYGRRGLASTPKLVSRRPVETGV